MKKSKAKKVAKKVTKKKVKKLLSEFCVEHPWGNNYMEAIQEVLENRFHAYPDEWLFDSDGEGLFIAKSKSVINKVAELFDLYHTDEPCDCFQNGEACTCNEDKHDKFWCEISQLKGLAYLSQDWKHLDIGFDQRSLKSIGLTLKEVANDGSCMRFKLYKN